MLVRFRVLVLITSTCLSCTKNRDSSAADIVTDLDGDDMTALHLYWIDEERLFRSKCRDRNSFTRDNCDLDKKSIIAQPFLSSMDAGLEEGVDEREAEITAIYVRIDQILRQMERIVTEGDEAVDPEGLRERIEAAEAVVGDQKIALHEIDQEIDAVIEALAELPSQDLRLQLVELKEARRETREAFDKATTELQSLRRQFIEANSGIFSARVYDALQRQTEFHEGRRREAQEKLNHQLRHVAAFNTIQEMLHFRGFAHEMMREQRELFILEKEFVKKFYAEFNKAWEEEDRRDQIANASSDLERWCLRNDLPEDQKYTLDLLMMWSRAERCREMSEWAAEKEVWNLAKLLEDRPIPQYLAVFRYFTSARYVKLGRFPSSIVRDLPSLTSVAAFETERLDPQDILLHESVKGVRVRVGEGVDIAKVKSVLSKPGLDAIHVSFMEEESFSFDFIENSGVKLLGISGRCRAAGSLRSADLEFLVVRGCAEFVSDRLRLPNLRLLLVSSDIDDFSVLRQFPKLEILSINGALLTNSLHRLDSGNPLELPNEEHLGAGSWWNNRNGISVLDSPRGLETLRQLTRLRVLGLFSYRNFSLDYLPDAPLEVLALPHMPISSIRPLQSFAPTLKYLALPNNEIDDLSGIEGLSELKHLFVRGNKLSAQDLEVLRGTLLNRLDAGEQRPALIRPVCPLEEGRCYF